MELEIETVEASIKEFLADELHEELQLRFSKGKDHFVLDFTRLALCDPGLAEFLLEEPEKCLKLFEVITRSTYAYINPLPRFTFRVRNLPPGADMDIGSIRSFHIGKLRSVAGVVRQKGAIRYHVTVVHYECPSCGSVSPKIQKKEKVEKPMMCKCGYRGKSWKVQKQDVIDAYSLLIEEDPEDHNVSQLSSIHVLCKTDLTNHEVYDRFGPGSKIRITGVLEVMDNEKVQLDHYVNANHIEVLAESYQEIELTPEDEAACKAFAAANKNVINVMREELFQPIYACMEEKEGILLQMFGGSSKDFALSKSRGNIHVLLVGEPGLAKSQLLKIAQRASPKARYALGAGTSGVGLTASVVKDELLGGFILEPGLLPLASGGLLCIDELDKAQEEDLGSMHGALEDQVVAINKANIHATLKAETTVLAAANPKYGVYSAHQSVFEQIDLMPTLINRFDLIFIIKQSRYTDEDHHKIIGRVLKRFSPGFEKEEGKLTDERLLFFKKYISYAKKIDPMLPEEMIDKIHEFFMRYRHLSEADDSTKKFPVTIRQIEGIRRLAQARARANLRAIVADEDVDEAMRIISHSLAQVGLNPSTGKLDMNYYETAGKTPGKHEIIPRIKEFLKTKEGEYSDGVPFNVLMDSFVGEFDSYTLEKVIDKLKSEGEIFSPRPNKFKLV